MASLLQDQQPSRLQPGGVATALILAIGPPAAVLLGVLVGYQPVLVLIPVSLGVLALIWRKPHIAIVLMLAGCTVVENFITSVGGHTVFTSNIPWWRSLTHGSILFPVEMFILAVLLMWIVRAGLARTFGVPKSPVGTVLKVFWGFLLVGVAVGMMHGAKLKYNLWEIRSWMYLTVGFVLAASLLRTRRALDAILWTLVLGTGFKGLEGTEIYFAYARSMNPRPEAILGHEEAFFMAIFITLTAALWLYGIRGKLRTAATSLFPFVLLTDLANARRAAWLVLALGFFVLFAIALKTLPTRRKLVSRALVVLTVVSIFYLPAYWNKDGTIAQPARAVKSEVHPDPRDKSSNLYRLEEDWNLIANIKADGPLGAGFGIPIEYSGIANISNIDPMIAYIPHNGVLWIWLRTGLQGEMAFWCLLAVAIVRCCRLARAPDPRLAIYGTLVAAAVVGYLADGYEDMAFAEFRVAMAMGCLLGVAEAALRLSRATDSNGEEPAGIWQPFRPLWEGSNACASPLATLGRTPSPSC